MTDTTCTCCGKPTNGLSARMGYPDALLDYYRQHGDKHDPYNANTMPSPEPGRAYIRALLHIP